jgi:hypothetical protein
LQNVFDSQRGYWRPKGHGWQLNPQQPCDLVANGEDDNWLPAKKYVKRRSATFLNKSLCYFWTAYKMYIANK